MSVEWVLLDREMLLAELQRVFDAQTAEALLGVLNKVAAQVRQASGTGANFEELRRIVAELAAETRKLAEAQARTEERLGRAEAAIERLAEAQARTEERLGRVEAAIERLAEAQARTEERLGRVEAAIERLAEAQARTEERLTRLEAVTEEHSKAIASLTKAVDQLRQQIGGLSETVGGDIEDIAYIVLHDVLQREFGWQVGRLERTWQSWDGEPEEVNVFGMAVDPARPEKTVWIVGEAKHNLTAREVEKFSRQVERARQHLEGEVFAVCFCYRARPEVQQQVRAAGMRLVFSYGKLV